MKFDIEAFILMNGLHLKQEKNKIYSPIECKYNIVYVFKDEEEFRNYFIENGFNISDDVLKLCRMMVTRKGSIIALKGLCDHAIRRHREVSKENNNNIIDDDLINRNKLKLLTTNFR